MAGSAPPAEFYWRRQLILTFAGVAVGTLAIALMRLSISREAAVAVAVLYDGSTVRSHSYLSTLWPAGLAILALAILTIVLLVHAFRVAAFTFRRGEN